MPISTDARSSNTLSSGRAPIVHTMGQIFERVLVNTNSYQLFPCNWYNMNVIVGRKQQLKTEDFIWIIYSSLGAKMLLYLFYW